MVTRRHSEIGPIRYAEPMPQTICYRLRIDRPHTHRVDVEMKLPALAGPLDLAIPAWTPGAYKIVDHARNVRKVVARTPGGDPLRVERMDLHTWRVHGTEEGAVVSYEVFADKLMIHQAQVNADHAFLNGGPIWMCVKQHRTMPVQVEIEAPSDWTVVSSLEPAGDFRWTASHYDALWDSPIEAGPVGFLRTHAAGVDWEIVWHDTLSSPPQGTPEIWAKVADGVCRLGKAAVELLGPAPFKRYVCFFHESTEPGYLNGLEHVGGLVMQGPLEIQGKADGFFQMVAHEIVHAWNGRRLAPVGLGRGADLWKPAHTTGLWVVEGVTEYYAALLCLRAGIQDPMTYYANLAEMISSYERTPGRRFTTLEEASFITWNFGDDRWNAAINYYLKGALTAWALDAEIRDITGGERSLDDVIRALWAEYGDHTEYEPRAVERIAENIAGAPLGDFFDLFLRSVEPIDWGAVAAKMGLELSFRETASLGMRASGPAGALKVEGVEAYGAAENAGLQAGDVLVTVNGKKATERLLGQARAAGKPGDRLALQALRGDRLLEFELVLGADRIYDLMPIARPTSRQARILESYLTS